MAIYLSVITLFQISKNVKPIEICKKDRFSMRVRYVCAYALQYAD